MDYKNKYKEEIIRATQLWECGDITRENLEYIFPELKESEDEKIKNHLIKLIKMSSEVGGFALHKWEADEMLAWLEKQGDQKDINPTLIEKEKIDNAFTQMMLKVKTAHETIHEDKIKPKFKVGDWIINKSHDICLIIDIDLENGYYICESNRFGNTDGDIDLTDKAYHLWTMQDAEDGDVLAVDSMPFIYNGSKVEVTVGAYCGFNAKHMFSFAYNYVINQNITPATKEQRDLLFSKIKETGYEWDAEKKELKKIEKQSEHKPAWSEEDENFFANICTIIDVDRNFTESAKRRCKDWLKSLKERYIWKPSKEQIIALRWVLNNISYNKHKEEISGLLEQIKKL